MAEELVFDDLAPKECPVVLAGAKLTLREPSGEAARKYRNAAARAAMFVDGKLSRMDNPADVEALLVSLCLFDESGKNVPQATVLAWPARVVKQLFDKANDLGGLNVPEVNGEAAAKKLPGG